MASTLLSPPLIRAIQQAAAERDGLSRFPAATRIAAIADAHGVSWCAVLAATRRELPELRMHNERGRLSPPQLTGKLASLTDVKASVLADSPEVFAVLYLLSLGKFGAKLWVQPDVYDKDGRHITGHQFSFAARRAIPAPERPTAEDDIP